MDKVQANILLAEDDTNLGFILQDYLELSGHKVSWQKDGEQGLEAFRKEDFDICILDIMMPLMDGFTLASEIRKIDEKIPIIFLTAKAMQDDIIKGLKIGADDYVTKPFSTEELALRIQAILKRITIKGTNENIFEIGIFSFDYPNQLLTAGESKKRLTNKEADVLKLLCQHKGELLKREVALTKIWGEDDYFMGRSMDVYITKLRKYMKDDPRIRINNVHGSGFMLEITDVNEKHK